MSMVSWNELSLSLCRGRRTGTVGRPAEGMAPEETKVAAPASRERTTISPLWWCHMLLGSTLLLVGQRK